MMVLPGKSRRRKKKITSILLERIQQQTGIAKGIIPVLFLLHFS